MRDTPLVRSDSACSSAHSTTRLCNPLSLDVVHALTRGGRDGAERVQRHMFPTNVARARGTRTRSSTLVEISSRSVGRQSSIVWDLKLLGPGTRKTDARPLYAPPSSVLSPGAPLSVCIATTQLVHSPTSSPPLPTPPSPPSDHRRTSHVIRREGQGTEGGTHGAFHFERIVFDNPPNGPADPHARATTRDRRTPTLRLRTHSLPVHTWVSGRAFARSALFLVRKSW